MQAPNEPASIAHSKVAPAGVDVNEKLASVAVVDAAGDDVIVVSGGGGSVIVQEYDAGVGSVPAAFVARTRNEWLPSARPDVASPGSSRRAKPPPSSAHSNVAPAGVDVNAKLGRSCSSSTRRAPDVIVVSGGTGAVIVQVKLAGVASVPNPLTARTWNVWLPTARPVYDLGVVQAANAAPSSAHSNVAPAGVDVNEKLASSPSSTPPATT